MKLILGALLGALISFGWGFVSWMQLGWHESGMYGFRDEAAVAEVIKANATQGHGIYLLPQMPEVLSFAAPDEQKKTKETYNAAKAGGPYMYAIVRPGRAEQDMMKNMLFSLARSFIAALLLAGLLQQTVMTYMARVAFCAAAGVFASVVCDAQLWIWFEAPDREMWVNLADHFIEWLLVGLVLGLFAGKVPTAQDVG